MNSYFLYRCAFAIPLLALCSGNDELRAETGRLGSAKEIAAVQGVEELVVYAQHRAQGEQDIPLAITALSGEQIVSRGRTSLADLAPILPNTVLVPGTSPNGPALGAQIRGIGQFDFNPAYEPGVAIYVDGVYFPLLTGSAIELLDIDHVEVARGPQGTLSGRNAIGGAIHVRTRTPDGKEEANVEVRLGSREHVGFRAAAGFRITDKSSARISVVRNRQNGYVDQIDFGCANPGNLQGIAASRPEGNCRIDRLGGIDYFGTRARVGFEGDGYELLFSADMVRLDQTNPAEVLMIARDTAYLCGPRCNYASFTLPAGATLLGSGLPAEASIQPNRQFFEGGGVSGQLGLPFGSGLRLDAISAYRRFHSTFGADDDLSPQPSGAGGSHKLDHDFLSQEIRIGKEAPDTLNWVAGGFFSHQTTTYLTRQDIRYIAPGKALQFVGDDRIEAGSLALFASATLAATDRINLTAGLRQSWDYKDYRFTRRNNDGTINAYLDPIGAANGSGYFNPLTGARALDGSIARYRGSHLDWRASVDMKFAAWLMGYATASTGFRGGGVSARPFNARQALEGIFEPETLRSFELGLKSDFLDNRFRINLAVFSSRHKDVLLSLRDCSDFGGGPCGVITNAGNAKLEGVELEMTARPADGWYLQSMASHVRGRWSRLDRRVGTSVAMSDPSTSAPPWKLSTSLMRELDLGPSGIVSLRTELSHIGKRFNGRALAATPYFIPSYQLLDARIGWTAPSGRFEASLMVSNLLNAYYFESRTDAIANFTGNAFGRIGAPRDFTFTTRWAF